MMMVMMMELLLWARRGIPGRWALKYKKASGVVVFYAQTAQPALKATLTYP